MDCKSNTEVAPHDTEVREGSRGVGSFFRPQDLGFILWQSVTAKLTAVK